jgi:hypothetical protein
MNRRLSARHGFALILALILCAVPVLAFAQDTPSVTVTDQDSDGSSVTVDNVVADAAGWIVIHLDNNGSPGPVIGQSAVEAGDNADVSVSLDPALEGDTSLWAMLHVDEGTVGTYEFPGPDVPVRDGDMIVMTPFVATVGAAEGDVDATEAMTDTAEMDDTAAMTDTEDMGDSEAMTDTADMGDMDAMTDTMDMGDDTEETAEAADMGDTEAMTDTADMGDTAYMTETEDMGDMDAMTDTMDMGDTTDAEGTDDAGDTTGGDTTGGDTTGGDTSGSGAPEVLPTTGAGLGGVAQALPAVLATLGALAGGVWISRRRG